MWWRFPVGDPVDSGRPLGWGVPVITGGEVISRQAAAQFELYTGVRPTPEDVAAAEEYASA